MLFRIFTTFTLWCFVVWSSVYWWAITCMGSAANEFFFCSSRTDQCCQLYENVSCIVTINIKTLFSVVKRIWRYSDTNHSIFDQCCQYNSKIQWYQLYYLKKVKQPRSTSTTVKSNWISFKFLTNYLIIGDVSWWPRELK